MKINNPHKFIDENGNEFMDLCGNKFYRNNLGELHRLNGPAIIWEDGFFEYYINGKKINVDNQKDFERYVKLISLS